METIKEIWTSLYTLTEKLSQKTSTGILIKIIFSTGKVGYNSIHPISRFKEGLLSDYIHILKHTPKINPKSYQTSVLSTILEDAYMDAEARSKNQSLLFGYPPIQNHFLILNIHSLESLDDLHFSTFKIKIGSHLSQETIKLRQIIKNTKKKFQLRLDFNEKLSETQWKKWEGENKDLLPFIDFIEDPFFNGSSISSAFRLAWDWHEPHYGLIRVLKASRYKLRWIHQQLSAAKFQRMIFTHSLSHPLEARLSWVKASQFYKVHPSKKEICGLNYPLNFYEKNDFSCFYSKFYAPLGSGFGFGSLLEKQNWKKLI